MRVARRAARRDGSDEAAEKPPHAALRRVSRVTVKCGRSSSVSAAGRAAGAWVVAAGVSSCRVVPESGSPASVTAGAGVNAARFARRAFVVRHGEVRDTDMRTIVVSAAGRAAGAWVVAAGVSSCRWCRSQAQPGFGNGRRERKAGSRGARSSSGTAKCAIPTGSAASRAVSASDGRCATQRAHAGRVRRARPMVRYPAAFAFAWVRSDSAGCSTAAEGPARPGGRERGVPDR